MNSCYQARAQSGVGRDCTKNTFSLCFQSKIKKIMSIVAGVACFSTAFAVSTYMEKQTGEQMPSMRLPITGPTAAPSSQASTTPETPKKMNLSKTPVILSPSQALAQWQAQAAQGDDAALFKLGLYYFYGQAGQQVDKQKAFTYFTESAQRGNLQGQYYLGLMYLSGDGGIKDEPLGRYWLEEASNHGSERATEKLIALAQPTQQKKQVTMVKKAKSHLAMKHKAKSSHSASLSPEAELAQDMKALDRDMRLLDREMAQLSRL